MEPKIDTPPTDTKDEVTEVNVNDDGDKIEESHTPPLLPNMKIKVLQNTQENQNEKKIKRNQWDMFAEQDIFKADTEVSCQFTGKRIQFLCVVLHSRQARFQQKPTLKIHL